MQEVPKKYLKSTWNLKKKVLISTWKVQKVPEKYKKYKTYLKDTLQVHKKYLRLILR